MAENLLRERLAESHKHNRPVDCVEAENVLADDVDICRPVLVIKLARAVGRVAECGDVV